MPKKKPKTDQELTIDRRTGKVRQAGASQAEGKFVQDFKETCEKDLFAFLDGIMDCWFLEPALHKPVCDWLTHFPPFRKMLLMPRNHGKSTIVPRGIPLHMMIQPKEGNIYFPGEIGNHLRLVIAAETETMAVAHLRVIKATLEGNPLFRALWPHVVWENPRRESPKWSDDQIIIPRDANFAEATIRAVGVGAAITGAHPRCLIKDDLTTEKAANEPPTMAKAIEWHQDSRALFANPDRDLEFITGTRWAAFDLPSFIQDNDPSVEVNSAWRRVVEDGAVIYPSKYGYPGAVEKLQKEHGIKFNLLFLNEVGGSDLCDFLISDLREYTIEGDNIVFTEQPIDGILEEATNRPARDPEPPRGMDLYQALNISNLQYLRNSRSL